MNLRNIIAGFITSLVIAVEGLLLFAIGISYGLFMFFELVAILLAFVHIILLTKWDKQNERKNY